MVNNNNRGEIRVKEMIEENPWRETGGKLTLDRICSISFLLLKQQKNEARVVKTGKRFEVKIKIGNSCLMGSLV